MTRDSETILGIRHVSVPYLLSADITEFPFRLSADTGYLMGHTNFPYLNFVI